MNAVLPIVISLTVLYGAACGHFGVEPGAPRWLSWPMPIWNRIAHDWRRPKPQPDYAKIERLERELGLRPARGGVVVPRDHGGIGPIVLSPGRQITDPDDAEALGLTADARRMRGKPTA